MLDTLKIYIHKEISLEQIIEKLLELKYSRQLEVSQAGDFSLRGDTLELYPANFNFPLRIEWNFDTVSKIYSFDKGLNKKIIDYEFLILIPYLKRSKRKYSEEMPLNAILKIKKGDYIVHTHYGIGKFLGIKKIKVKNELEAFFQIEYQNKDVLYVTREDAHLIQKYVNFSLKIPRLTRLGTKEWTRMREKVEKGIKNFALEFLKREAKRQILGGIKYSADTQWQKDFESKFIYDETEDQAQAIDEVKADMELDKPMDRLICGDVGYGKTEVAMRAAFKAIMDGRQVAFLVPTTILAYQHYKNLKSRLSDFPVNVEMLSRFRTKKEQNKIVESVAKGKIDIIVGTHRLFSLDIRFKNLGLLIIDEEQKFGVAHKEKIKSIKAGVDVLTLTATPIPRTLYMSLIGIKNISIIKTPPKDRLAIKTKVLEFKKNIAYEAIIREIKRGGQVFFIHNRIESIFKIEKKIKQALGSDLKIGTIHGRMSSRDIEKIMFDFIEKRIDCLLSTTIVESGIDIPAANTIIINDAHRLGLADLHQLRGRVGRQKTQAYAYLLVPNKHILSSDIKRRLKLIEEFSHLGSGFDVAMSDLELRGAGNILGLEQHGFVWMVGFDLYCRLLKKEIEYLKEITGKFK